MTIVRIDNSRCIGCKLCYDLCPMDVFTWNKEAKLPEVAYDEECWACGICWMDCPTRCIDIRLPASNW